MKEELSIASHGFKLPINVSAVLYNDVLDNLIVFYWISEGEYKHITIESDDIWEYIVSKGYNLDFTYYVNGEELSFGYDAQGFQQFMKFWQPDINKIISEYFNNELNG